jgi:hypothetical protein
MLEFLCIQCSFVDGACRVQCLWTHMRDQSIVAGSGRHSVLAKRKVPMTARCRQHLVEPRDDPRDEWKDPFPQRVTDLPPRATDTQDELKIRVLKALQMLARLAISATIDQFT